MKLPSGRSGLALDLGVGGGGERAAQGVAKGALGVVLAAVLDPDAAGLVVEPRLEEEEGVGRLGREIAGLGAHTLGQGAAHLGLHRGPLQLDVMVAGEEDDLVAGLEHAGHGVDEAGVAGEDLGDEVRRQGGGERGAEAPRAPGPAGRRLLGLDAQEIEDVAVEDELEGCAAALGVLAQVLTEAVQILVVEECFEAVIAAGLGVLAATEVQVTQDDEVHASSNTRGTRGTRVIRGSRRPRVLRRPSDRSTCART